MTKSLDELSEQKNNIPQFSHATFRTWAGLCIPEIEGDQREIHHGSLGFCSDYLSTGS